MTTSLIVQNLNHCFSLLDSVILWEPFAKNYSNCQTKEKSVILGLTSIFRAQSRTREIFGSIFGCLLKA